LGYSRRKTSTCKGRTKEEILVGNVLELLELEMKVFVVVWGISGLIRVMGVYTKYESAESKLLEMKNNQIQGFYRIVESEVYD
jgi:hypothetical protein